MKPREVEVLLVDDNPADVDLTREALQAGGHAVHLLTARDGMEAMAHLRQQGSDSPVELVVLDLNLPRMDGRAVLSAIRKDETFRKTPVVIFTTSQAARDIKLSYELGANCYVSKPGNLTDFMAAIDALARFWLKFVSLPLRGPNG